MKSHARFLMLGTLILLVGGGFRVAFLRVHGIDADEAFSLMMASRPVVVILKNFINLAVEVDAQLYHLLLAPWLSLAGSSEFALRFVNVSFDLLLGAALLALTQASFGQRVALTAVILWCFNPLLIWVDGIIRMYTLIGMLAGVSWLAAIRAQRGISLSWWIIASVTAVAAVYTHVLGIMVMAGTVTAAGWSLLKRKWQGSVIVGIGMLLCLPYVIPIFLNQVGVERRLGSDLPQNPIEFLLSFVVILITNLTSLTDNVVWFLAIFSFAIITFVWRARRVQGVDTLMIILLVAVFSSAYLALRQSIFEGRYIAYVIPIMLVALAVGIDRLPLMVVRAGAILVFVGAGFYGYLDQQRPLARDDFRSGVQFLGQHVDASDLILVVGDYGLPPFEYYYRGPASVQSPWHTVPNPKKVDQALSKLSGYDTVWLVLYQTNIADPKNKVDTWFRDRYAIRTEVFPTGLNVRGYDLRPMTDSLPPEATPLNVSFEGGAVLKGYQLYQEQYSATDTRLHPPSGWVHATLYWEAARQNIQFEPRVEVQDELGQVWGLAFTRGSETFLRFPSAAWLPGQIWRTDFDINMNPVTPDGRYAVVVQVLSPGSEQLQEAVDSANSRVSQVIVEYIKVKSSP